MIRQALEAKGIILTNNEFAAVMYITTQDIKFNRISFNKRTSFNETVQIAVKSAIALRRCV